VEVGIDCTAGPCEAVAGAPAPVPPASPPPPPFQWVLPNVLTDFNVAVGISAFGYFELRVGNPLWETLQLKMVEGQAGLAQTANFAPAAGRLPCSASSRMARRPRTNSNGLLILSRISRKFPYLTYAAWTSGPPSADFTSWG